MVDKSLKEWMYQVTSSGGGGNHKELAQAEYDALTEEEKTNGTVYFITDGSPAQQKLIFNGSATTNSNGAIDLEASTGVLPTDSVVWVHILTGNTNAMAIPFRYSNAVGHWYAKIVLWTTMASVNNTAFTFEVCVLR